MTPVSAIFWKIMYETTSRLSVCIVEIANLRIKKIRNVISFANCNQYLVHASVLLNLLASTFYVFIWVTCTFMILITFLSGKLYQYLNCGHQMRPIKKIGNTPTFPSFFLSLGLLIFFWWKNKPALVCVTMYIPRWIKI